MVGVASQRLSKYICRVGVASNKFDLQVARLDKFTDEVLPDIDMLDLVVRPSVGCQGHGTLVVAVE